MAALGHQRRLRRPTGIAVLPPEADIRMIAGVRRCGDKLAERAEGSAMGRMGVAQSRICAR